MTATELALIAFDFVTTEIGPLIMVIGAISIADLFIWFLVRLFKKMPFQGKVKW